ncbi:MAG: hypothetical protein FJ147_24060 [Deltaproteobacteria bacterium]|nr:hypothetical protein [Deltaproteobacteria bacterium]
MKALLWLLCILNSANGVWMLIAPESWYTDLPAAVPDTGPLNVHFIRDIGVTFTILGVGFGWCAMNLERCYPVYVGLTAWVVGHALLHVVDILTGRLPSTHWGIDASLVFLPALLLLVLALPPVWQSILRRHRLVF